MSIELISVVHHDGARAMPDLIFLALGLGGFALMTVYAALTAKL